MKREAQPALSVGGQQVLDQYATVLKQEDLAAKSTRNYLSDLRQFMAWCEYSWRDEHDQQSFTPQKVAPSLLIRYRAYLQTTLWLKPSSINRALMSLKRYFAWAVKEQLIQGDPTDTVKFLPKEVTAPDTWKMMKKTHWSLLSTHMERYETGRLLRSCFIRGYEQRSCVP